MRLVLLPLLFLSACGQFGFSGPDLSPPPGMLHPMPRPGAGAGGVPPRDANTAAEFDTTTDAERQAALANPAPSGEALLGSTIATLGNPADPGFWLETPLVSEIRSGRVKSASGVSVKVELRPIDGPASGGSRISLSALRLLNVGLTGLHELSVFVE